MHKVNLTDLAGELILATINSDAGGIGRENGLLNLRELPHFMFPRESENSKGDQWAFQHSLGICFSQAVQAG